MYIYIYRLNQVNNTNMIWSCIHGIYAFFRNSLISPIQFESFVYSFIVPEDREDVPY